MDCGHYVSFIPPQPLGGRAGHKYRVSAGLDPVTPMHDGTALGYPLPAGRRFRLWHDMMVEIE
jgi:hypothetical protein